MSSLDIILLLFLAWGAYKGYRSGFFLTIISLVALIAAVLIAALLYTGFVSEVSGYFDISSPVIRFIAFAILVIAIYLLINFTSKIIKKALDLTFAGFIDNLAGSALGILKVASFISIFFWLLQLGDISLPDNMQYDSLLYKPIAKIAPFIVRLFLNV